MYCHGSGAGARSGLHTEGCADKVSNLCLFLFVFPSHQCKIATSQQLHGSVINQK